MCHLGLRTLPICRQMRRLRQQPELPPSHLGPERAWVEVHHNCLREDFTRNLRECYMCWILEYVIVTVFRTLEFDNEAMCYAGLGMG